MIPYFIIDQINLGPVKLYTWGLFVGLGFSLGYILFYFLAKKTDLAPEKIMSLALALFVGAILGAKALAWALVSGGAMFMGGLLGAIIFGWLGVKLLKLDFWQIADLLVLPAALGIGIGRIGCALINDHQGAITSLVWGILWPDGIIRHPVAIYESLVGFGMLAVFWFLRKRLAQSGQLFLVFLASYSLIRFFLDFTRVASGSLADPRQGIFSISQWLAGIIFIISAVLFVYKRKC
ncbi:MAG TPA: prolipoprotein diacylglyceryl transferase [Candidatus Portnoybacteria bacterium]|nr:prolipoprotein diacylglyceryl transferase [Candidatus Portnoybacteria bacterium]